MAVDNLDGYEDLTIHDGKVNGFGYLLAARDASRNRAFGNGNPAECLNVFCE
jgi:hypothetical protein